MLELLNRFWKEEEGQDLVEYALIVALVALLLVTTFDNVRSSIRTVFDKVKEKLDSASSG